MLAPVGESNYEFLITKQPKTLSAVLFWHSRCELHAAKAGVDFAEHSADDRAKNHQRRDNNNGNQNKNQCIFDEALAFFFRGK